jgi:hypothetical protein
VKSGASQTGNCGLKSTAILYDDRRGAAVYEAEAVTLMPIGEE